MTSENLQNLNTVVGPIILSLFLLFLALEFFIFAQPLPKNRLGHGVRNFVISFINVRILGLGGALIISMSIWSQVRDIGLLYKLQLHENMIVIAGCVLLYDLLNYLTHRSLHKFPILWRLHRVHHSDPYIDVTSSFYFNPLESVYRVTVQLIFVILVGVPPIALAIYTVCVVSSLLFSHSNLRIAAWFESLTKYVLVLPNAHRVHHSKLRHEHDSNYGIGFMMWDHIFGTYTAPDSENQFRIGLKEYSGQQLSIIETLLDPIKTTKN